MEELHCVLLETNAVIKQELISEEFESDRLDETIVFEEEFILGESQRNQLPVDQVY